MLQLEGVTKSYRLGDTTTEILHGIDLRVLWGEYTAITGPSGSGKSTLMNILGCLEKPSRGRLFFDARDLTGLGDDALTDLRNFRIGFVFQQFNLLPRLTALENVAVPLMFSGVPERARLERARELLAQVGLQQRLEHRPTQLSGGEQQRVAIARALVGRPAIILADEPTGNVDSTTGAEIMALLQHLNREQGVTLLLVTHDAEAAAFAGRVVHLRDGRVEGQGLGEVRDQVP